jgi:hypothetical protein
MNNVSAQDEFTRWAKIRREHDKVLAEHDKKGNPTLVASTDLAQIFL